MPAYEENARLKDFFKVTTGGGLGPVLPPPAAAPPPPFLSTAT
jgi:hypothetical protein